MRALPVAPHAGAWIETGGWEDGMKMPDGRPSCRGVDRNQEAWNRVVREHKSPLMQGRGSKLPRPDTAMSSTGSPLMQGRGSKPGSGRRCERHHQSPLMQGCGVKAGDGWRG